MAGEEFLQQAERLPVLRELRGVIGVHVTCFFFVLLRERVLQR